MRLADRFLSILGSSDKNVGRVFWDNNLGSAIIVTSYVEDEVWFYKKYDLLSKTLYGVQERSERPLSYYINLKLEEEI